MEKEWKSGWFYCSLATVSRRDSIVEDFRRARREDCGDDYLVFGGQEVEAVTGTQSQLGAFMGESMAYTSGLAFGALVVAEDVRNFNIEPRRSRCELVIGGQNRGPSLVIDLQGHSTSPLLLLTLETITEEAPQRSQLPSRWNE